MHATPHQQSHLPAERSRAVAAHPAGGVGDGREATTRTVPDVGAAPARIPGSRSTSPVALATEEDGSLVTEYGLLAVVAATVAGVVIQWASGGALVSLFNALLRHARSLVGA